MKPFDSFKQILIRCIPLRNYILFESIPDFSDNTLCVFQEMVNRGLHQKYQFIWMQNFKSSSPPDWFPKNIKCVHRHSKIGRIYRKTAKYTISCNDFLASVRDGQYSLFLNHGTALKTTSEFYVLPEHMTQVLAASDESNELTARYFKYDKSKSIVLGFPRNDVFAQSPRNLTPFFGNYSKVISWYPTYRHRTNGFGSASANELPLLYSEENAVALNNKLIKDNVLIIIKPHPAQDVSRIKKWNLSNILLINDDFFRRNKISSYEFLNACDAMITDYSSVYYDYLLCNKPIGAVWEDIEEYLQFPGLIDNYEYYMGGAEKIYTIEDMIGFVERVAKDEDVLYEQRNRLKLLMNYSDDGQNTKRVVDYIETVLNNK